MRPPNIVYILADDMGCGDVGHLNPDCAFPTPNLDRLAAEGMHFSDAHSSSAVCTPSRYSILTGRYCWRTWLKRGVLGGVGRPLIEPGRPTIASLLREAGYRTACIGKWHLGWDWAVKEGHQENSDRGSGDGTQLDWIDYRRPIAGGPTSLGFDRFYGISGSLDMPPYVYVRDDRPVEEPTAWATPNEFIRQGPRMRSLRANNVLGHLTGQAVSFIHEQDAETPFFLYFPLTAPHTPIAPADSFAGRSGVNPYADFCMEVDARVGQVLDALAERGLAEDTLVIFTADNGASAKPSECAVLEERYGHFCSHRHRGYKSDIWDGGHRLPFLVRWPRVVHPGGVCDQPIGIFDLFATAAELTGTVPGADAGEDSVSFAPALRGQAIPGTDERVLIHHSIDGRFAIRQGDRKLCRCPGSGGWSLPDAMAREQGMPEMQLYDLASDPGESCNLIDACRDEAQRLTRLLHRAVVAGRTTPGPRRANDASVPLESWEQLVWLPEIPERFVLDD